jgi:hypothetical protein
MGYLSKDLEKYYTRDGNRIVFSNGMTLNQLAWEMWERLRYREIDPSVVSRVLKGERLFTSKQLNIFGNIIGMSNKDVVTLQENLLHELSLKFGLEANFFHHKNKHIFDLIEDNINKIREVGKRDLPCLANEWLIHVLDRVNAEMEINHNPKMRRLLLNYKGSLLNNRLTALLATEPLKRIQITVTQVSHDLKEVGTELKNKKFIGAAASLKGNMLYIIGQNESAVKCLSAGLKLGITDWEAVAALRAMAISLAELHKESQFKENKNKLLKIAEFDAKNRDYIYEGLARGEAVLGKRRDAQEMINLAWNAYNNNQKSQIETSQLKKIEMIRTELKLKKTFGIKRDISEKTISEGARLAQKLGYTRLEEQISNLANEIIN